MAADTPTHMPLGAVQRLIERGIARNPNDYSVRDDVVSRADAVTIAGTLCLHCRYDKPGKYYTFSTAPLRPYQFTEVLR